MNNRNNLSSRLILSILVLVSVFVIIFFAVRVLREHNSNFQSSSNLIRIKESSKSINSNDPFIGQKQAPITVVLWSDYQCPFCKKLEEDVIPKLIRDYVTTGKVKLVFKDHPFIGSDSLDASLISRAVWEIAPDKFYAWYQAVFAHQDEENSAWGSRSDLLDLLRSIDGINENRVMQVLSTHSNLFKQEISANLNEAKELGIKSFPTISIANNKIVGVQPYSSVSQLIDLFFLNK